MPSIEQSSVKKTYFDPSIVVDETGATVMLGLKRNFLVETDNDGDSNRTTGDQWLVLKDKKLTWEEPTNGVPKWIIEVPADVWKAIQVFLINYKP